MIFETKMKNFLRTILVSILFILNVSKIAHGSANSTTDSSQTVVRTSPTSENNTAEQLNVSTSTTTIVGVPVTTDPATQTINSTAPEISTTNVVNSQEAMILNTTTSPLTSPTSSGPTVSTTNATSTIPTTGNITSTMSTISTASPIISTTSMATRLDLQSTTETPAVTTSNHSPTNTIAPSTSTSISTSTTGPTSPTTIVTTIPMVNTSTVTPQLQNTTATLSSVVTTKETSRDISLVPKSSTLTITLNAGTSSTTKETTIPGISTMSSVTPMGSMATHSSTIITTLPPKTTMSPTKSITKAPDVSKQTIDIIIEGLDEDKFDKESFKSKLASVINVYCKSSASNCKTQRSLTANGILVVHVKSSTSGVIVSFYVFYKDETTNTIKSAMDSDQLERLIVSDNFAGELGFQKIKKYEGVTTTEKKDLEIWVIAVLAAGGFLFLVFVILIIQQCRSSDNDDHEFSNIENGKRNDFHRENVAARYDDIPLNANRLSSVNYSHTTFMNNDGNGHIPSNSKEEHVYDNPVAVECEEVTEDHEQEQKIAKKAEEMSTSL